MRPISLKLSGLHSFRERQEVRFDILCQGGVFGIFGPTGSGKSSILDAITLALFGKVERADRNTVGIMNHAENTLSVSFTFELHNAIQTRRYRVERSYKRSDDLRLRPVSCRLVEVIAEEEQVLADKQNEVSSKIEAILGLTVEDFTRAVVLPQGKFAEFLTLEGKARRQMLERLFGLERYGNRLLERLKVRKDAAAARVNEIKAEQQGLGDCSQVALENARLKFEQASHVAQECRQQLMIKEKELEQQRQLWQWQQEKEQLETEQNKLRIQEPEIVELEQKLEMSQQAEQLRPYLEELKEAELQAIHWQNQCGQLEEQVHGMKADYEDYRQQYQTAQHNRSQQEPQLAVRLEALKQAEEIYTQLQMQQKEIADLTVQNGQIQLECTQKEQEQGKLSHTLEKAIIKQTELKAEMEKKMVKAAERQRIQAAFQLKERLDYVLAEWNHSKQIRTEKEKELRELQDKLHSYQVAEREWLDKVKFQLDQILQQYHLLSEAGERLNLYRIKITSHQKHYNQKLNEEKEHLLAQQLVLHLRDGEPCLVCGSKEHPQPAELRKEDHIESIGKELELLENNAEQLRNREQQIVQMKYQLEHLSKQFYEVINQDQLPQRELALAEPISFEDSFSVGQINRLPELTTFFATLDQIAHDIQEIDHARNEILPVMKQISQKQSEWQTHLLNGEQVFTELKRKEQKLFDDIEVYQLEWQNHFHPYKQEEIEVLQTEIHQRDQVMEQLQERVNKSIEFIDQVKNDLKITERQLNDLQKNILQTEVELRNRTQQVTENQSRLEALAGGEDIYQAKQALHAKLKELKDQEDLARTRFEKLDKDLRELQNLYTAATQSVALAKSRRISSLTKWEEVIQLSSFKKMEDVENSLLSSSIRQEWKGKIDAYRDALHFLHAKLANLHNLMEGRSITGEEWNFLQQQVIHAKQLDEEAVQERARTERDLEEMRMKSQRWSQLEEQRMGLQNLLDRLIKLQSVFRGNAFVDYIAEEQLTQISIEASKRLGNLTRGRYAIEVDAEGGFMIRDDANGGVKRPVTTLSGGETFLTSLALALSLSAQVQLRGEYPLEFFFLDEGFGTLDQELLDTVISTLERLHGDHLSIGVISHVPELRERIQRRLVVEPADSTGQGSRVMLETM